MGFGLLGIFSIISTCVQGIKEACTPVIPADNWANKELMDKDRASGMSEDQIMRNVKNGRYMLRVAYPVPHREQNGQRRIIIENDELYREDINEVGAYQARKWMEQGKYNLNAEELEIATLKIERKYQYLYSIGNTDEQYKKKIAEIDAKLATKKWDYRRTEAAQQWLQAHLANMGGR